MRLARAAFAAVCVLFVILPVSRVEAAQRIRIDCSNVINQPGTYVVRNSVRSCITTLAIIRITSDNVTLDLNGNVLDGANSIDCPAGIHAIGSLVDVRVRNGVVRDCAQGIIFDDTVTRSSITKMRTVRNTGEGIFVKDDITIANNVSSLNGEGIFTGDGNVIRNNITENNTNEGIRSSGDAEITGNTVVGNGSTFGLVSGGGGSLVADNVVRANIGGIFLSTGDVGRNNVVEDNQGFGIQTITSQGVKLIGNRVRGNRTGMHLNGNNTVSKNVVTGNSGAGIHVTGVGNVLRDNVASHNGDDGMELAQEDNDIIGNRADGNGGDGIHVVVAGPDTTVKRNVANDNNQHGIRAADAVAGIGTNRAKNNQLEPQCIPVDLCV